MSVEIANVVGSGDLHTELDLQALWEDLDTPYLEYNPSNYHGLYIRLEEGGPLVTVYRSGKYIISGCSSFDLLHNTDANLLTELAELGVVRDNNDSEFTVQNLVCTAELGHEVNLSTLSIGLGLESIEYEPEQFPGLIFRPPAIDAVLLIFTNGKMVITGAKDIDTAEIAYNHLQEKIEEFE